MFMTIISGCSTQETTPPPQPQPETPIEATAEVPAIDSEAVLLDVTTSFLNSIPDNSNMMKAEDVLKLIEDNPDAIMVLDIRAKEDYEEGHLPGATNIPYGALGKNLDRLPHNKQIILICYTGQGTGQAVASLKMLGFNAISMSLGMNFGWKPLELSVDTLESDEQPLPETKNPILTEEEIIVWDAIVAYYSQGTNYIEQPGKVHDLNEMNPNGLMILDIRSEEDFQKGHIEGAVNIPFKTVGKNLDKLPKDKPIYIACYSGQTAGQVTAALRLIGYEAHPIARGMLGWNGEELPVVQ